MNTLTTTPAALKAALAVPLKVTVRRSVKKIFECVRLEWGADGAHIAATDLTWACVSELPGEADRPGVACVPIHELASLSRLKSEAIRFTLDGDNLIAEWRGKATSARREIRCEDASQFPEMPDVDPRHEFPELGTVLAEAQVFSGKEAARFVLNAIQIDRTGIVATDGRRLYRFRRDMEACGMVGPLPIKGKLLASIRSYNSDGNRWVVFGGAGFTLTGRIMDGNFPDYTQIIPRDFAVEAPVDSDAWLEAIEAVEPSVSVESQAVLLELRRTELTVSAAGGDSKTEARIPIKGTEVTHRMGFNPAYLKDLLRLKPTVFRMNNRNCAAVFNGGPRELVLMPVLID